MSYPTVFGNLAAGNQPASLFDTMFNIAGQQGNIPCTASGTNAITVTPSTNYYLPTAYTIAQIVSFKATATSTGNVTLAITGLAFVKLFTAAGVQAASGDIVINTHYTAQYWADLDSGNGGFIILNASVTAISSPPAASFKKLEITNGGTPNTQVALTADAVVVQNGSGGTARVTSVSVTISTATTGANALDIGPVANDTWYAVYVIYNPTTVTTAGLLSTNATSPALPSGYTYFARLGWVRTDGSADLYRTLQYGRKAQYKITAATNTAVVRNMANGIQGTYSTSSPVLQAITISTFVPPTATEIAYLVSGTYQNGTGSSWLVAPSTDWGGTNNGPAGSAGQIYQAWSGPADIAQSGNMVLEGTTIAVASTAAGFGISVMGWTDNI